MLECGQGSGTEQGGLDRQREDLNMHFPTWRGFNLRSRNPRNQLRLPVERNVTTFDL